MLLFQGPVPPREFSNSLISIARQAAAALFVAGLAGSGLTVAPALADPPAFAEPEERRSVDRVLETRLEVGYATNMLDGREVTLRSYEGGLTGPTLRLRAGDTLRVRLDNTLPAVASDHAHGAADAASGAHGAAHANLPHGFNNTNLHTHGLHVSPSGNSDNVLLNIGPGESFDYEFRIPEDHPPGTYWYHPHLHGSVALQVASGMAGALIIEGALDAVPEIAAARDRVMVFQTTAVDDTGRLEDFATLFDMQAETDRHFVNGLNRPVIEMRPGEVQRWRLIHAGYEQFMPIAVDGHQLVQIEMDGNAFEAPRTVDGVLLAPGNRTSVMIRAGAPGDYLVRRSAFQQGSADLPEEDLLILRVRGAPMDMALPSGPLPQSPLLAPIADDEITGRRTLTLEVATVEGQYQDLLFEIDGRGFDHDRIDQRVRLGAVEEWTFVNRTGFPHPMHIHVNPFQVIAVNGAPVDDRMWLDTAIVPANGSLTMRTRFQTYTGTFVLHCHILPHEDLGMMQIVSIEE